MPDGIKHLDFYPAGPETIASLVEMHAIDPRQPEIETQGVSLQRERTYAAILETSVAMCGTNIGFLGYQAVRHNEHGQSDTSERPPEMTLGIVASFVVVAALARGITRAWGAKTWERIKTVTSRD